MELFSERLIIRDTRVSDADLFLVLFNTSKWIEFCGERNVNSIQDAEKYIVEKIIPTYLKYGYANCTLFLKDTNQKVGICGIYNRDKTEHVDIGYALLPEFEKMGFAFEACQRMIQFAKEETELKVLKAFIDLKNVESITLIEKLGFQLEKQEHFEGDPKPVFQYSLTIK